MKYIINGKTMLYKSKLKGSFGRIYPISILIIYILCLIEVFVRWMFLQRGYEILYIPAFSFVVAALFFWTMGFLQLKRYQLWIYPLLGFFVGLGCILAIYFMPDKRLIFKIIYFTNFLIILLLILINWTTLSSQEKFEANARRLFKLASEGITETSDGFTNRPYSVGEIEINKEDLIGFARFVNGNFIARSVHHTNTIDLVFSMNTSVLKTIQADKVSYISISQEGKLAVHLSQEDYGQYKSTLNFDQLCESMGSVFTRFIRYYKSGLENRIINELKKAR